ncbi:MAG TPA: nuclear transport factor 2 family protein [Actinospica sp.]|nr:nuclear transport factor 2 family protein [Actinospica sp.]
MSDRIRTPRETVDELLRVVVQGPRTAIADLYTADVRIENPWSPSGVPSVSEGREAMRARMAQTEKLWTFDSVQDVVLHETADPETVVLEYRVNATVHVAEGPDPKVSLGFVSIMRIVDGLIVSARDYSNPLETAELSKRIDFGAA